MDVLGLGYYLDEHSEAEPAEAQPPASEEINIDDDDDDDEAIEQVQVPAEVFGSAGLGTDESEPLGALERIKRAKSSA